MSLADRTATREPIGVVAPVVAALVVLRGTYGFSQREGLEWTGLLADALTGLLALLVILGPLRPSRHFTRAAKLLVAFAVMCAVFTGPTLYLSLPMGLLGLRSLVLAPLTILLVQSAGLSDRALRLITRTLLLVVLANCVVAAQQAVFGYSSDEIRAIAATGSTYIVGDRIRLIGLQASGQDLSIIVGAATVWGFNELRKHGARRVSWLTLMTTGASAVTTFLVLQRSVLLGVACALALVIGWVLLSSEQLMEKKQWVRRLLVAACVAVGALAIGAKVAPAQFAEGISRLLSLFDLSGDHSWSTRLTSTIPVSLRLVAENPRGYGVGTTGSVAAAFPSLSPISHEVYGGLWTDNGYLFVAMQIGIIGMVIWVLFLLHWAREGRLVCEFRAGPLDAAVVVAFLAGAMLSGSFWGLSSTMTLVLLFTSLGSGGMRAQRREPNPELATRPGEPQSGRLADPIGGRIGHESRTKRKVRM